MDFQILRTCLRDLVPDDPMYPAVAVHLLGTDAGLCYDAVETSVYVIGRGPLIHADIDGPAYYFVASRPDYPALYESLRPWWPEMPERFPLLRLYRDVSPTNSQELADAINYVAVPPCPDPTILNEARTALRDLVPHDHLTATPCCGRRNRPSAVSRQGG